MWLCEAISDFSGGRTWVVVLLWVCVCAIAALGLSRLIARGHRPHANTGGMAPPVEWIVPCLFAMVLYVLGTGAEYVLC